VKINCVIVVDNDSEFETDRGIRAGRQMAEGLRRDFVGWELHVHVRKPDDKRGIDDAYARYTP